MFLSFQWAVKGGPVHELNEHGQSTVIGEKRQTGLIKVTNSLFLSYLILGLITDGGFEWINQTLGTYKSCMEVDIYTKVST